MGHVIEAALNVRVDHPPLSPSGVGEQVDFGDGVMAAPTWAESITRFLESGFPERLERVFDARLQAAVKDRWNSERTEFAGCFGDVHAACRVCTPELCRGQEVHEASTGLRRLDDHLVHARRVLSRMRLA